MKDGFWLQGRRRSAPRRPIVGAVLGSLLSGGVAVSAAAPTDSPPSLAPGYRELPYPAPAPGSYTLAPIGDAADGRVIDAGGAATSLHRVFGGRIVLLSFIYSTCDDVNGCPLAMTVLQKVKGRLRESPDLARQVRLVTLSFNPKHDTPEVLARYAEGFRTPDLDWQFLTTSSPDDLQPILRGYQQSVEKEIDARGRQTGKFSHLLRVLLIDRQARIRNVYTVSVLHPDLVLADIHTLALEDAGLPAKPDATAPQTPAADLLRAGDAKQGYESADYRTRSVALAERRGRKADLAANVQQPPLGLPKVPIPPDNPLTPAKIDLGRKLFYDRRLSLNETFSCAMCHIPEQGFTSQEQATAIGIEGRTVRRNAPTIYNVAYLETLFHDARESSLEHQIWGPLLAANEMANPSVGAVVDKLKRLADYSGLFERAFGRGPSIENVGQALASYERTLISGGSRFDRWRYGREPAALSDAEQRGFELFTGPAGCAACHTIGPDSALFTDQQLHNTGLGYRRSMQTPPAKQRVQVAPGLIYEIDAALVAQVAEPPPGDLGRYEITLNPADRWKYRTPSLRNVALTAPYMHDGSLRTLRDVVEFYNRGSVPNEGLDSRIKPLGLDEDQIDALVAFLQSLTGDNVETLVLDAYAAPIGDPR